MTDSHDLPSPADIIAAHDEIEKAYDMKYTGVRVAAPKLKLRRILRTVEEEEGLYDRAARLLRDLITRHLFEDGNKRTAWAVTNEYLARQGETPAVTGPPAERFLLRIRRYNADEIAEWLETGELDEDRLEP